MVAAPFILVVDDEEDSREVLGKVLSLAGYQVDILPSGQRVVERAALLAPAAIILDVAMPGMDGFTVAWNLKADERTRRIPIIGFSGRVKEAEARLAGFDYFLQKGTDPTELLQVIQQAIGR